MKNDTNLKSNFRVQQPLNCCGKYTFKFLRNIVKNNKGDLFKKKTLGRI